MTNSTYPDRFGIFQAPFHKFGIHPAVLFERDLQLIQRAEELGFHEAWVGEHHSGGHEPIGAPDVFMAAASQRTRTIKLGTGVNSLPYHNPFMVAERHVLLDHLSRGRAIMGFGPGQLASDAHMMAVETAEQRDMMLESADVIVRLIRGETVSKKTSWFELRDARLQVLPYDGELETVVASVASPSGPRTAGQLGLGMLNLASTGAGAFEALRDHWSIVETEAAKSGASVSRKNWRLAAIMHIAETEEQARKECAYGFEEIWNYLGQISPLPTSQATTLEGKLDEAINAGMVCIGTPDTAIELIRKLGKQTGG
ncbi:MAG: LLM class flavin-dependent oxidoreductase, partial [Rhodococcus sp. (in: high G+C Gram-positive bacteria)]|uniref:LLM class flavin-dependent oxidoreductase n=1 Tax=Rhodococcus sp. TaxID=1831 RepID=UPI003BAE5EC6